MRRTVVVGGPGAGKSTVALALAARRGAAPVELDALWWGPDWTPVERSVFAHRVDLHTPADGAWVADGNYFDEAGASSLWPKATMIVWLDPPRAVAVLRAVLRSIRRLRNRELLWHTNRETLQNLTPRSLWRLWRRWPDYNRRIEQMLAETARPDLGVVRLRSSRDVARWLAALG